MHRYRNGLKTAALLGLLSAGVLLLGQWVAGTTGLMIAFLASLAMNGWAYFNSAKIALRAMRAQPVSEAQAPGLYRMVRELSYAAGQPMPRLYVAPTDAPNAFATGRNPRNAAVCVTEGILALLDERELRGVIGHELAHVYNRDILTASVAASIASVIMMIANMWFLLPVTNTDDEDGPGPIATTLILLLGPLAATVVQLAIGRSREYEADADGARLTCDPLALASALRKLELGTRARPLPPRPDLETASALMIANPFRGGGLAQMFSTHPPMRERIARLEEMAAANILRR
jgi:heat shock protein HtpX